MPGSFLTEWKFKYFKHAGGDCGKYCGLMVLYSRSDIAWSGLRNGRERWDREVECNLLNVQAERR